jgi:hypothetical protein
MIMKKLIALMASLAICVVLVGCGEPEVNTQPPPDAASTMPPSGTGPGSTPPADTTTPPADTTTPPADTATTPPADTTTPPADAPKDGDEKKE